MNQKYTSGFTLMELALSIAVVGIVVGGSLGVAAVFKKNYNYEETQARLDTIVEAIKVYYSINGTLPCPAPRNAVVDTAEFGVADCVSSSSSTGVVEIPSGSPSARMGVLPVRDLGLPASMMFDKWGGRFLYAVTTTHTGGAYTGWGVIDMRDAQDNALLTDSDGVGTGASYVVLSHGADQKGAFSANNGVLKMACAVEGEDRENCDEDDVSFTDTSINDMAASADYFDDVVRWGGNFKVDISVAYGGGSTTPYVSGTLFRLGNDAFFQPGQFNMGIGCGDLYCDAEISGSRVATYEDVVHHANDYTSGNAWFYSTGYTTSLTNLNDCNDFSSSAATDRALVLNGDGTIQDVACDGVAYILCFDPG